MEYWIVYDLATGEELHAGSGTPGTAAMQLLEPGTGLLLVPQAVVVTMPRDLVALRAALAARVGAEAEQFCLQFVTPGMTKSMRYTRKEAEALAWQADNTNVGPLLAREAQDCGIDVAKVVADCLSNAHPMITVGAFAEAREMKVKRALAAAQTFGEIVLASDADWPGLLAELQAALA